MSNGSSAFNTRRPDREIPGTSCGPAPMSIMVSPSRTALSAWLAVRTNDASAILIKTPDASCLNCPCLNCKSGTVKLIRYRQVSSILADTEAGIASTLKAIVFVLTGLANEFIARALLRVRPCRPATFSRAPATRQVPAVSLALLPHLPRPVLRTQGYPLYRAPCLRTRSSRSSNTSTRAAVSSRRCAWSRSIPIPSATTARLRRACPRRARRTGGPLASDPRAPDG